MKRFIPKMINIYIIKTAYRCRYSIIGFLFRIVHSFSETLNGPSNELPWT